MTRHITSRIKPPEADSVGAPCVFVVQGFFTAKAQRARRVFCWFVVILQGKTRIGTKPSPDGQVQLIMEPIVREGSAGWTKMLGYLTEAQSTQRSSVRIREGKKVNLSVPCVFVVQGFLPLRREGRKGFLVGLC